MKSPKMPPPPPTVAAPEVKPSATEDEIANAKKRSQQARARMGRRNLRVDLTRTGGSGLSIPE